MAFVTDALWKGQKRKSSRIHTMNLAAKLLCMRSEASLRGRLRPLGAWPRRADASRCGAGGYIPAMIAPPSVRHRHRKPFSAARGSSCWCGVNYHFALHQHVRGDAKRCSRSRVARIDDWFLLRKARILEIPMFSHRPIMSFAGLRRPCLQLPALPSSATVVSVSKAGAGVVTLPFGSIRDRGDNLECFALPSRHSTQE